MNREEEGRGTAEHGYDDLMEPRPPALAAGKGMNVQLEWQLSRGDGGCTAGGTAAVDAMAAVGGVVEVSWLRGIWIVVRRLA